MAVIHGTLADVARSVDGRLVGGDRSYDEVTTDTRDLEPGQLFVALRGPNFDGNDFVAKACAKGAAGALVDAVQDSALAQIEVANTKDALGRLARAWRSRFDLPVVGVTGSNGKTTVKEMIKSVLAGMGNVLATRGNLNNEIGVPLTLMRLGREHAYAVIEMGANHHGEIAYLTKLASPAVALVTNAGPAHLDGFGSVEGVARAKGEIYANLPQAKTAVINADDPHAGLWASMAENRPIVTFGVAESADVRVTDITQLVSGEGAQLKFRLRTPSGSAVVGLAMAGRHNAINAAAAAAVAHVLGATPAQIASGLAVTVPVRGRLQILTGKSGARLIDDCYNANPNSLAAALEFVTGLTGDTWLVLGDMGELGGESAGMHRETGDRARKSGVRRLFGIGELSRHAVAAFGPEGRHFEDMESLIDGLSQALHEGVNLLVKGSRAMRLERLVDALTDAGPSASGH